MDVRVIAIYNLEQLASESQDNYRLVYDILYRYLYSHAAWKEGREQYTPAPAMTSDIQAVVTYFVRRRDLKIKPGQKNEFVFGRVDIPEELTKGSIWAEDFSGIDLRGIHIKYAFLESWSFRSSHLEGANLSNTLFDSVDFEDATLSNANLRHAIFYDASLKNANLSGADLEGADLHKAKNLDIKSVKSAKNYDKATLPPEIMAELNK
jgi:hypothetical protein